MFQEVYKVFHVSFFELYRTPPEQEEAKPPPTEVDGKEHWEIKEILDSRTHYGKLQYLVRWLGYSDSNNQWLSMVELQHVEKLTLAFHKKYSNKPQYGGCSLKRC